MHARDGGGGGKQVRLARAWCGAAHVHAAGEGRVGGDDADAGARGAIVRVADAQPRHV